MKNIVSIIIFCFICVTTYSQNGNSVTFHTKSITVERASKPSNVSATAVKAHLISKSTQVENNNLFIVEKSADKTNEKQKNITATAELAVTKNTQSTKTSNINIQANDIKLERQSSPSNIKATAEIAN
jgi:hypothetical protein